MERRLVVLGLSLVALAAACSAADTSKQPLIISCAPGSKDCPTDRKPKSAPGDPATPVEPPAAPLEPVEPPDAGRVPTDAAVPMGAQCTALKACCANLTKAGITGSARQCNECVDSKSEVACQILHDDFKKPGETYDPVCF